MEKSQREHAYNIDLSEENLLGEGSYGQVYKIQRKVDGLECAAKIFKVPLAYMDPNQMLGYKRESKILKLADHPFVIQYIEEFPFQNLKHCIVTRFASGGDFEKLMIKKVKFTEDEALEYFAMILLGLDFLHSKNIFHRDLKPGNIFIVELNDGKKLLCIGDFGVSKYNLDTIKQTQTTLGFNTTPLYQAPEVINMKEPDSKVDIWALGIIFYQLLTSKHPFQKPIFVQTVISIKDLDYDPLPLNISASSQKIVSLLLQKDPVNRPDAQSLLKIKEVQIVVDKLISNICATNRKMAVNLIDQHQLTWINPNIIKQDQVQLTLDAVTKVQLQLVTQNCQNKEEILAVIDKLKTDKMFDNSSDKEVSTLLEKISAMTDIFLEMTSKININIKNNVEDAVQFVTTQKEREIQELSHSLLVSFKEMEVMLKEKEEIIAKLNDELQQRQQDAQAVVTLNRQHQVDLLQKTNEELNEIEKIVNQLNVKNPQPVNQNVPTQQDQQQVIQHKTSAAQILNLIIDQFLMNSQCVTDDQQKQYLLQLLGNKRRVTNLLYRGSEHGWKGKDFHTRCDNKGPTISLFKLKDGDLIGGYTKAQWKDVSPTKYVVDPRAFLFNLSSPCQFKGNKKAGIACYTTNGPNFGQEGQITGLSAREPFNGENQCQSWAAFDGYNIGYEAGGKSKLTKRNYQFFTITELEVWEVKRSQTCKNQ